MKKKVEWAPPPVCIFYFLSFILSPQGRNGKSMSVKGRITKIHVIQMDLFGSEVARLPSQHNG